ncbi:hypothetical protein L1887_54113 [Cichorium endivia]|nr:hypothetical protein L1887_54113 [Cichorium endivia]
MVARPVPLWADEADALAHAIEVGLGAHVEQVLVERGNTEQASDEADLVRHAALQAGPIKGILAFCGSWIGALDDAAAKECGMRQDGFGGRRLREVLDGLGCKCRVGRRDRLGRGRRGALAMLQWRNLEDTLC